MKLGSAPSWKVMGVWWVAISRKSSLLTPQLTWWNTNDHLSRGRIPLHHTLIPPNIFGEDRQIAYLCLPVGHFLLRSPIEFYIPPNKTKYQLTTVNILHEYSKMVKYRA
eukprot:TRINITY_DN152_c0_g1_i2.p2 TRINITY_DN152_c0_g1~~TRINITY_DN152_c0_g1_i2.p2  ORF type:complete len:109 (+),score=5.90 TRINITY_DN152_c0_g1_i2:1354-1680(+)